MKARRYQRLYFPTRIISFMVLASTTSQVWQLEAEKIEIRAQHIIIPNLAGKRQVAVYCADAVDCWRFNSVILVPEGTDLSPLRSVTEQKAVLDLSVTYRHFNSDRTSGPTMIRQMKEMALPRSCRPYDAPSLRGFL